MVERHDLLALARQWADNPAQWPLQPCFDPQQRWYHRMSADAATEVWLLTWLPGQGTDLHDHGGSTGAFTVVSGQLTELTPRSARLHTEILLPGHGHRFGARYIHQVTNRGTEPAVSVHAYGPALTAMRRYEFTDSGPRIAAVDVAGSQW